MEPSRETSGPGFGGGDVCGCPKTKHGTANISTTMTDSFFTGRSFGMRELMLCMSAKAVNMSSSFFVIAGWILRSVSPFRVTVDKSPYHLLIVKKATQKRKVDFREAPVE
jgi:hypothetical protein